MKRLDQTLFSRGLARSRTEAQSLIRAGQVRINGQACPKPSEPIADTDELAVVGPTAPYVSRAGLKLAAALDAFGINVTGLTVLDAGASTGGWTDCLLQHGALRVVALDVGHRQMVPTLAANPRVENREGVNLRSVTPADFDAPFALVVADLSFISLTLVLPVIASLLSDDGQLICLIKPQFEVGIGGLDKHGIVRDPQARERAIENVRQAAIACNLIERGLMTSPIFGTEGNQEYLIWLSLKAGISMSERE